MKKKYLFLFLLVSFGNSLHAMEDDAASSSSPASLIPKKQPCMALVLYKDPQIQKLEVFGKIFGINIDELTDDVIKAQECVVCYNDFKPTKQNPHPTMITLTAHGQTHYHWSCLQGWLKKQATCPTCFTSLADLAPKAAPQPETTQNTTPQDQDRTPLAQAKRHVEILKEQYFRMKKRARYFLAVGLSIGIPIGLFLASLGQPPINPTWQCPVYPPEFYDPDPPLLGPFQNLPLLGPPQ